MECARLKKKTDHADAMLQVGEFMVNEWISLENLTTVRSSVLTSNLKQIWDF